MEGLLSKSKAKQRLKRARRKKNRRDRDALLGASQGGEGRLRGDFQAKARAGDAAALDFKFGGPAVPYDPAAADPSQDVARRVAAVVAWDDAGNPTEGDA